MPESYRDLDVWNAAMDLLVSGYELCHRLPSTERFGLTSQLRRALVSVPSNIAEGNASVHRATYVTHLSIARGSLAEVDTLLEAALRVGYVTAEDVAGARGLMDRIGRMLTALANRLRQRVRTSRPGTSVH